MELVVHTELNDEKVRLWCHTVRSSPVTALTRVLVPRRCVPAWGGLHCANIHVSTGGVTGRGDGLVHSVRVENTLVGSVYDVSVAVWSAVAVYGAVT